jgi:DNA repair protein RecN (Recombination protein N)
LLLELRVQDFGIIEDIYWKLGDGLNIITGETGAGKSLIVDAVELLLNGTSSEDVIRSGAVKAKIEGIFSISEEKKNTDLRLLLNEKDLAFNEDTLILNYEIRKEKPGIAKINGQAVTKTFLRQVGQLLIDIHGQSEHLSLLDKKQQLLFLDAYAHCIDLRKQFALKVAHLHEIESELITIFQSEQDSVRKEEFLKYQIEEIKQANLHPGEDEELENERNIISYAEKLKEYSVKTYQALSETDPSQHSVSALTKIFEAAQNLKKLVNLDPTLNKQLDYLNKTIYGLEEIARDIHFYGDRLLNDPSRLEEIESRLELIRGLKRKYGKTISDILNYRDKVKLELEGINNSLEKSLKLKNQKEGLKKELGVIALKLSQIRSQSAVKMIADVMKELEDIQMSQVKFEISISQAPSPDGIGDDKCFAFNEDGIDNVEYLVSTNPGEPLKSLSKIASTGELSRFTLAVKESLSEADNIPILLFDEIDIGIGGRNGDIIGRKLWNLAKYHQIICVTHLPQIAVYADEHFYVDKKSQNSRTTTSLERLSADQRIKELAAMLDGPNYSRTALKNAIELKKKTDYWKNTKENRSEKKPTQLSF